MPAAQTTSDDILAEAKLVHKETGMTPRQLADAIENGKARNGFERDEFKATLMRMENERAELLAALRGLVDSWITSKDEAMDMTAAITVATMAMDKAEGRA